MTITTTDGVQLAYARRGAGPPLVLVHGGATNHHCFDSVVPALAARFDTIAYDRRGRGDSGTADDRSLAREARDLAEVAAAADGPVDVLAYSYGGLVSLHAMAHEALPVRRALLYEPPFGVPGLFPGTLVADITALVAARRYDEACRLFVRDTFLLSERTVERMTRTPLWAAAVDAGPTLPGELEAILAARPEDYRAVDARVRILVQRDGGNPAFRDVAERLVAALANADIETIDAVPHFAMSSHPDDFAAAALAFFTA